MIVLHLLPLETGGWQRHREAATVPGLGKRASEVSGESLCRVLPPEVSSSPRVVCRAAGSVLSQYRKYMQQAAPLQHTEIPNLKTQLENSSLKSVTSFLGFLQGHSG